MSTIHLLAVAALVLGSGLPHAGTKPGSAHGTSRVRPLYFRFYAQRSAEFGGQGQTHGPVRIRVGPLTARVKDYDDRGAAVHPNGRFVYTVAGSSFVYQDRIDRGQVVVALRPPTVEAHSHPSSISFHPNGRFVYVSCSHGAICQYRIRRSGQLVPLSPPDVGGWSDPTPLRFDRSGRFACCVATGPDLSAQPGPSDDQIIYVYIYRVNSDGTLKLLREIHVKQINEWAEFLVVRGNKVSAARSARPRSDGPVRERK